MIEDFFKIVTGHDMDSVKTNIVSDIEKYGQETQFQTRWWLVQATNMEVLSADE
jgi:hypothetical protein